jgi:hypothetical protein
MGEGYTEIDYIDILITFKLILIFYEIPSVTISLSRPLARIFETSCHIVY